MLKKSWSVLKGRFSDDIPYHSSRHQVKSVRQHNPEAAQRVSQRLRGAIKGLVAMPKIGRSVENTLGEIRALIFALTLLLFYLPLGFAFGSVDYSFDKFDSGRTDMNEFYAMKGRWETAGSIINESIDSEIYHGTHGKSLKLEYDLSTCGSEGGYWEHFTYYYPDPNNPIYDMSEFDEFHFFIKGGSPRTTKCYMEFVDKNWNKVLVEITGINGSWQKKSVTNLQSYTQVDWRQMMQWAIVLKNDHVDSQTGVIYLDDLTFVDTDVTIQNDMDFVNLWQKRMFKFFWDCANPANGLIRDRATNWNECSIAAAGFGLSAICIGIERGWVSYGDGYNRVLTTLNSFYDDPNNTNDFCVQGKDGLFYHFVDMNTGEWINGKDGVSTIDTALLMAGVLTCRRYFAGTPVETLADNIFRAADWASFKRQDHALYMLWTPLGGYSGKWLGYNEGMILYLMAIGSPTHSIPSTSWDAWAAGYHWDTYYGYRVLTCPPLFTHQYSHCWVDFRGKKDNFANYFQNSINATLANRAYCRDIWYPQEDIWGMSATDSWDGYKAFGYPPSAGGNDTEINDGTVDPHSTIASLVFTPDYSISSSRYIYDQYKDDMWGIYGLTSGINTYRDPDWFDDDYIGINLGDATIMIENSQSKLIWNTFMQNDEITFAMDDVGLVNDHDVGIWSDPNSAPVQIHDGILTVEFSYSAPGVLLVGVMDNTFEHIYWLKDDCTITESFSKIMAQELHCPPVEVPVDTGYVFWLISPVSLADIEWSDGPYHLYFYAFQG